MDRKNLANFIGKYFPGGDEFYECCAAINRINKWKDKEDQKEKSSLCELYDGWLMVKLPLHKKIEGSCHHCILKEDDNYIKTFMETKVKRMHDCKQAERKPIKQEKQLEFTDGYTSEEETKRKKKKTSFKKIPKTILKRRMLLKKKKIKQKKVSLLDELMMQPFYMPSD